MLSRDTPFRSLSQRSCRKTLSMDSGIATVAKQNCASPEEQKDFFPSKNME
jgi:hypothetical protein